MHYHLEIVMPPTDDIKGAVTQILEPFNEQGANEDGDRNLHGFWDWWVIGGRWAGNKLLATYDEDRLDKFNKELQQLKVTVSGFQSGKQELKPETQIPVVDALWQKFFPESGNVPCPLFAHSNDQYKSESLLPDDVMRFGDVPAGLKSSHIIFAKQNYKNTGLVAEAMFQKQVWNGVTFQDTTWDGTFAKAVEMFNKKTECYKDEYAEKIRPKADWLVVTVDYHS